MKILSTIFLLYYEGFKSMTLGRSLWLIILLKILIIFGILKTFIYNNSFDKLYPNQELKSQFVTKNLKLH